MVRYNPAELTERIEYRWKQVEMRIGQLSAQYFDYICYFAL